MWSVILREKHRSRVFKNRRLMKTFGPKRKEITGKWQKLCNEELHYSCSIPKVIQVNESKRRKWARHVVCERK